MAKSLFSIASSTGKISNKDSDDEGEGNSSTNNKYKIEGMDLVRNQQVDGYRSENLGDSNTDEMEEVNSRESSQEDRNSRSSNSSSDDGSEYSGTSSSTDVKANQQKDKETSNKLRGQVRGGSLTKSLEEVSNKLLGKMILAQSKLDDNPEDMFKDAQQDYEASDKDDCMSDGSSNNKMNSLSAGSADDSYATNSDEDKMADSVNKEDIMMKLKGLNEDNRLVEERDQDYKERFRIRLDPANFM
jgi:hypothetical protein